MPTQVKQSADPMQNLRRDYYNNQNNQKTGLLKQLKNAFKEKKTDPVNPVKNIETLISASNSQKPFKIKDALLIKSVLERQIKNNPNNSSAKDLRQPTENLLIEADFSFEKAPTWKGETDMRMNCKGKDISAYQTEVIGQINRDYPRAGISIIDQTLFDNNKSETETKTRTQNVETALISQVQNHRSSANQEKIKKFVQRAMVMGTQEVMNGAYMKYISDNSTQPMPADALPGVTRFSVDSTGLKIESQTVYEKANSQENGHETNTETVFYTSAFMSFEKYLDNDEEFSNPQEIPVAVQVYTETQDIKKV